jgi:hypothetical protein
LGRAEFAGGEGVEGAEAGGEFGGGEAALAVEAAEKIVGRLFSFPGVAFHAAGDQVAVGIAPNRACGTTWSRDWLEHTAEDNSDRRKKKREALGNLTSASSTTST